VIALVNQRSTSMMSTTATRANGLEIYKCVLLTIIALLLAANWINVPWLIRQRAGVPVIVRNTVTVDGQVEVEGSTGGYPVRVEIER
jgi:hypothetical protein